MVSQYRAGRPARRPTCDKLHAPPAGTGKGSSSRKEESVAVETETIRNVCLIGHRGSGKTTIAEAMIGLASGRSGPASGVLDYAEEESERG